MKFEILDIFVRSATIEIKSDAPWRSDTPHRIFVDQKEWCVTDQNVVTITGLKPDTEYEICVAGEDESAGSAGGEAKRLCTLHESVLLDVRRFGADGDGVHEDTAAIQAAILCCPAQGTVWLPKGTYLVSPLFLKSDMTLWLDEGARLLGHPDRKKYPILPGMTFGTDEKSEYNLASWEGNPLDSFASLITCMNVRNVDIIGPGVLDGGASESDWWTDAKVRRIAWRPNTVFIAYSENVRMQNLTVCNSPSWTMHPYYSDHLRFLNLSIQNPPDSPNTDGFDPESCTDILLVGTKISVGDDCIAIKSGKYYMSRNHFRRTKDITIRNCLFERGHGSVTVGSEIASGVEDVYISDCVFDGTDRGVRLKTRRGRGQTSFVGNIVFERIVMRGVHVPMTVNMFYNCDPDGHSHAVQDQEARPVDDLTPMIGDLVVKDAVITGAEVAIVCAYGLPEQPIGRIELRNITASFLPEEERTPGLALMMDNLDKMSGKSFWIKNAKEVILDNVTVTGSVDEAPELYNIGSTTINNVQYNK